MMTVQELKEYQEQMRAENALLLAKFDNLVKDFQEFKQLYNNRGS